MENNVKKKKAHIGWQVYIGRHETQVLLKKRMREQSHSKNDIVLIGERKGTSAHHAMLSQYPFHITKGKILGGSCILKNTDANIYILCNNYKSLPSKTIKQARVICGWLDSPLIQFFESNAF